MPRTSLALQHELEQRLYGEARLLDEGRLHDWLGLLTDDIRYLMPTREIGQVVDDDFADDSLAFRLFDEDKNSLTMRALRMDTGLAHVETPPSITHRQITNVEVERLSAAEAGVRSSFVVYQVRLDKFESTFRGTRRDRWRRVNGEWKLARREILLAHPVLPRTISLFF